MAFPDRIERTVEVAQPPEKVWAALTTAEGLGAWFGDEATIDLRPGGAAWMRWNEEGFTAEMRVERVEEPVVFGFTWSIYGLPSDDPRRTYVEFTLEPAPVAATASSTNSCSTTARRQPLHDRVLRRAVVEHEFVLLAVAATGAGRGVE